jgi:hypothetical protein
LGKYMCDAVTHGTGANNSNLIHTAKINESARIEISGL